MTGTTRSTRRRGRRLWPVAVVAAGVVAGSAWLALSEGVGSSTARIAPVEFEVTLAGIEEHVTAQGKLEPKQFVDVGAQVSGQLERIHVEIGDDVEAGQLLAEIDPRVYEARVRADEARLKALEAARMEQEALVSQARQKLERNQRLLKSRAVAEQTHEDAETALKVAEAKLLSIEAQTDEAQSTLDGDRTNLEYTKIYAPIAGTVVLKGVREGQTLNSSQSAPTIVQLADLDTMTVKAQVAEADIGRLMPGMSVYFRTLGSADRRWDGAVRQILPSPEIINDVVLYNVLVDVDNRDRRLMTGMSTQMFFVLGKAEAVPVVPVTALRKRLEGEDDANGQAYQVQLPGEDSPQAATVHVGLMDRTHAEIRGGLKPGDKVLLPQIQARERSARRSAGPRL